MADLRVEFTFGYHFEFTIWVNSLKWVNMNISVAFIQRRRAGVFIYTTSPRRSPWSHTWKDKSSQWFSSQTSFGDNSNGNMLCVRMNGACSVPCTAYFQSPNWSASIPMEWNFIQLSWFCCRNGFHVSFCRCQFFLQRFDEFYVFILSSVKTKNRKQKQSGNRVTNIVCIEYIRRDNIISSAD